MEQEGRPENSALQKSSLEVTKACIKVSASRSDRMDLILAMLER